MTVKTRRTSGGFSAIGRLQAAEEFRGAFAVDLVRMSHGDAADQAEEAGRAAAAAAVEQHKNHAAGRPPWPAGCLIQSIPAACSSSSVTSTAAQAEAATGSSPFFRYDITTATANPTTAESRQAVD